MAQVLKQFGYALATNLVDLRDDIELDPKTVSNDRVYANKAAYHLLKQKHEFATFISPYNNLLEFGKNFFWEPLKAWVKLGYGLFNLFDAIGRPDAGARVLYGFALIGRSVAQIYTANIRAVCRALSTLVHYLIDPKEEPQAEQLAAPGVDIYKLIGISGKEEKTLTLAPAPQAEPVRYESVADASLISVSNIFQKKPEAVDPFAYLNEEEAPVIDFTNAH